MDMDLGTDMEAHLFCDGCSEEILAGQHMLEIRISEGNCIMVHKNLDCLLGITEVEDVEITSLTSGRNCTIINGGNQ